MEAIETFTHNGNTVEILPDFDGSCSNPRDDCNLGTFWTMERRATSPDKLPVRDNIFESVANTLGGSAYADSNAKVLDKKAVWLPVWKYEHSGVAYAAAGSNPFHCPWDSGQAGYIFVSLENVRKEYACKRVTKAIRAKVLEVLKAEVQAYSQWASGEVYGFVVKDKEGHELDSCWGFLGMDHVKESAIEAANAA